MPSLKKLLGKLGVSDATSSESVRLFRRGLGMACTQLFFFIRKVSFEKPESFRQLKNVRRNTLSEPIQLLNAEVNLGMSRTYGQPSVRDLGRPRSTRDRSAPLK